MRKTLLFLLLAAVGAAPAQSGAPGVAQSAWPLSPTGYGPARIGMTRVEVEQALATTLEGEPVDPQYECVEMTAREHYPDMVFLFLNRRLNSISVAQQSRVRTPRGIGIGASAAQVRLAYPRGLIARDHAYDGAPAEYLTFWTVRERSGTRFITNANRRVDAIIAGNESIQYMEGCV